MLGSRVILIGANKFSFHFVSCWPCKYLRNTHCKFGHLQSGLHAEPMRTIGTLFASPQLRSRFGFVSDGLLTRNALHGSSNMFSSSSRTRVRESLIHQSISARKSKGFWVMLMRHTNTDIRVGILNSPIRFDANKVSDANS